MKINCVGSHIRNAVFGTDSAISKGLREFGVEVNDVDPSFPNQKFIENADFNLIFKYFPDNHPEYKEQFLKTSNKRIVYQPDDLRYFHIRQMMVDMRAYCDYALTYDSEAAVIAREELGYIKTARLLLTADNELYRHVPEHSKNKDIDFLFIGSFTGGDNHKDRRRMVEILDKAGFNVFIAADLYDMDKMMEFLNKAKVVLNHATSIGQPFGQGWGLQCRHFEAGMTKACILSNEVIDDDFSLRSFCRFKDEKNLVDKASFLLNNKYYREEMADDLHLEIYKSHLPVHRAKEIVEFVRGL